MWLTQVMLYVVYAASILDRNLVAWAETWTRPFYTRTIMTFYDGM